MFLLPEEIVEAELASRSLTVRQAEALEKQLKEDPMKLDSRVTLCAYYRFRNLFCPWNKKDRSRFETHALWFIENAYNTKAAGSYLLQIESFFYPEAYARGKELWLNHLEDDCTTVNAYINASKYFRIQEPQRSLKILETATEIYTEEEELFILFGHACLRSYKYSPQDISQKFLHKAETSYRHYKSLTGKEDRLLAAELCKVLFHSQKWEQSASYAKEALALVSKNDPWNHEIKILHEAHTVLGLIALGDSDILKALEHLSLSVDVSTSDKPRIQVCLQLANDLLRLGHRKEVELFLQKCLKLSPLSTPKIISCLIKIKLGQTPTLPVINTLA